jgi:ATP-dependent Clp protease protease subunit
MTKISKKDKKSKKVSEEIQSEEEVTETEEGQQEPQASMLDLLGALQGEKQENPEARSIMFVGPIDEEKSADLISALLVLSQQKPPGAERAKDIKIYISTYGGSADEMLAIYDVMNYCKQFCDIETIDLGKVMSAGTLLLAAGTKGKRRLGSHCRVMIHSVNGGSVGELHSIQNEIDQMKSLQDNYIQCLSNETSMTKRQVQRLINRKVNVYLSAEEAIELGLADGVM